MVINKSVKSSVVVNGIYFDRTSISEIDLQKLKVFYHGYDLDQLAQQVSFEEVIYLLIYGDLPNRAQLNQSHKNLFETNAGFQKLEIRKFLEKNVDSNKTHPMKMLSLGLSFLAVSENKNIDWKDIKNTESLIFQVIFLIIEIIRFVKQSDQQVFNPSNSLSKNILHLLSDSDNFSAMDISVINTLLILNAEHGFNASSFAARVVASTNANFYAALLAAVSAYQGDMHGGAIDHVMSMLSELRSYPTASDYVDQKLLEGKRLMGFGHPIYKFGDPRVRLAKKVGAELGQSKEQSQWFQMVNSLEEVMLGLKPDKPIYR